MAKYTCFVNIKSYVEFDIEAEAGLTEEEAIKLIDVSKIDPNGVKVHHSSSDIIHEIECSLKENKESVEVWERVQTDD